MAPLLPTGFPGPPFGGPSAIGGLGPTGGERGGPSPTSPLPVAKQSVKISISAGLRRMINYTKGLPLLTRVVVVAILITYFLDVILGVPLRDKWALDPRKMSLSQSMYGVFLKKQIPKEWGLEKGLIKYILYLC
jgi:hypothetical protein